MNPNEIDISKIDLEKLKDRTTDSPSLLPYAHTVGGVVIKPEDKGKIKGRAGAAMHQQTEMQMSQLYEQMQLLAEQANTIKKRIEVSERIYSATMPFEPIISHVYHLYKRHNDEDILSMIGPTEWGRSKPFKEFVASVKLLADHTWEILNHQS